MREIVFVVYPGFQQLDATGPASVFHGANRAVGREAVGGSVRGSVRASGRRPIRPARAAPYRITVASTTGGPICSSSGIVVQTDSAGSLGRRPIDTLLIVGADREELMPALADPLLARTLLRWARRARRIGSVCSGAFLLARCGLLDGHRVATHWDACAALARAFPAVCVDAEALYVNDGRLWTSAGVTTGIDMALALVAQDLGPAIAGDVAKRLVLYARRPGHQSQFSPILSAQARADHPFNDLIAWIQSHPEARLDVPTLAARVALSERTFHRRFVAATGETPARFVEMVRLQAARLLLSRGLSLKTVAAKVGLFPAIRLNEAFARRYGISPRLYRELHGDLDRDSDDGLGRDSDDELARDSDDGPGDDWNDGSHDGLD